MNYYHSFDEAVRELLNGRTPILSPVSGGDINKAYRLDVPGKTVFVKANREEDVRFFDAEARGLGAIAKTSAIGTPEVLGIGTDTVYGAFLLLEWVEGRPGKYFFETFGHRLAAMHLADASSFVPGGTFGFEADNYIGAGEQENTPESSWITFFRDHRLIPQLRKAEGYFDPTDRRKLTYLLDHLDKYLLEPAFPSLLHGDLWSGNYITGSDGEAWLIDPAVSVGHFEADLAMTELFGGFPQSFYCAYNELNPIDQGYRERREFYNLYHLLNHLNLFGVSYLGAVRRILRQYTQGNKLAK